MNKAFLLIPVWALAVSLSFASERDAAAEVVQEVDPPMIHIDSQQLNLIFGTDVYRIALSQVAKQDYKLVGLIKPADSAAYAAFMYCALRKVALDQDYEYWILLPSRSSDSGYVSYLRTESEAKYFTGKSFNRVKVHSVHQPSASVDICWQAAQGK